MSELYSKIYAEEILEKLGRYSKHRIDSDYDTSAKIEYSKVYKGYGFFIKSSFTSSYVYSDEQIDYHLNNLTIEFCDRKVLSTKEDYYIPGEWEEVLRELNYKSTILKEENDEQQYNEDYIIDNIITPYNNLSRPEKEYLNKKLAERNIIMSVKELSEGDVDTYNHEFYKKFRIYDNHQLVLDLDYYGKKYDSYNHDTYQKYRVRTNELQSIQSTISYYISSTKEEYRISKDNEYTSNVNKYLKLLRDK